MATLLFMFVPKILSLRKMRKARREKRAGQGGPMTQQYLEKMKAEQETEIPMLESTSTTQHGTGLIIRKFESKLIMSADSDAGA